LCGRPPDAVPKNTVSENQNSMWCVNSNMK
jgi:hypothetical protein